MDCKHRPADLLLAAPAGCLIAQSDFESKGVSLERVLEFANLKPEAALHAPTDATLDAGWPASGALEFECVRLRYRPSLPPALDGFSYSCKGTRLHMPMPTPPRTPPPSLMAL